MNNDRMDELNEQLEDAYFALLLNRYAESEGRKQQEEYEKAAARNELPPVPEDLDAKCRDLIRKSSAKGRRKQLIQRTLPRIGRIAAVMLVVLGLCTTLVFSVDALRIPVMNFIIDRYEQFTSIGKDVHAPTTDYTDRNQDNTVDPLLADILPNTFELLNYTSAPNGTVLCSYQDHHGNTISVSISNYNGVLNIDTEDALSIQIDILEHKGFYVEKNGKLTILWLDELRDKTFRLSSNGIEKDQLWNIALAIAEKYCSTEDNVT